MKRDSNSGLWTLVRLKGLEEQAAAERLSAARDRLDQESKNLTTLKHYLAEYSSESRPTSAQSRMLAEGHRFRHKLQQTVEAQMQAVAQAKIQAETARAHWASIRSEREAVDKLLDERRRVGRKRELSGEQRQSDEQAIRNAAKQAR